MAGDGRDERDRWVVRVLGVDPAPTRPNPADLVGIWWDAKDRINEQLETLRQAFADTDRPLAADAAQRGLSSLTGGTLVRFQAALLSCKQATRPQTKKLPALTASTRASIRTNRVLDILERNPFGLDITIRADTLAALDRIEAALEKMES